MDDRDGLLTPAPILLPSGMLLAPRTIIGHKQDGSPIFMIAGGAPDDLDIEGGDGSGGEGDLVDSDVDMSGDDGDDDDDLDGDDNDDADSKVKPPVKAAPAKVAPKKQAPAKPGETKLELTLRREREARKAAESQLKAVRLQHESDAEKQQREAEEAAQAKYKPVAIRSAARSALHDAKVKGDPGRATRLIDLEALDIDDDGEVIGLDAQVEWLKNEYPELFDAEVDPDAAPPKKVPAKKAAPKIDAGNKKPVSEKHQSSAERIANMVLTGQD